jgi:predicted DNA binding CopG/RHH family protein
MSRQVHAGGANTRGSAGSVAKLRPRKVEKDKPDSVEFDSIDWETVEPVKMELDPSLIEHIRARRNLKQITLRVGVEQIDEARRVAARAGLKYQAVLRRWLAEGASLARSKRARMPARIKSVGERRAQTERRPRISRAG